MRESIVKLVDEIESCALCADDLPLGPRPVVRINPKASILIAGQAPGTKVHQSGIPFDDASGDRLRNWMGIDRKIFYDVRKIAIVPMGFCYPGRGKSGDLPPLPLCAKTWRQRILDRLINIELVLPIGQYAHAWHIPTRKRTLTETVESWQEYGEGLMPLPHPSPRNNIWLAKNPWFEKKLVPVLQERVKACLQP
ncbi:uracil-DNA glycosylase family protein [Aurantivibrio infirmus]